eukprot:tig00000829_g4643.t1
MANCVRGSLIALNAFYVLWAIPIIAVGGAALAALRMYDPAGAFPQGAPVGFIVVGIFLLFVSVFGIISAKKEERRMLLAYSILNFIFFILLFSMALAMFVVANNVENSSIINDSLNRWGTSATPEEVCSTYKNLACSGVEQSCGVKYVDKICPDLCKEVDNYTEACGAKVSGALSKSVRPAAGVVMFGAIAILLGFIFAVSLYRRNTYERGGSDYL